MSEIANRINNLSESETIAMSQKSRELQAEGKNIINLSLGEPDFSTPDFIKNAAKQAIDDDFTKYMPVPGYEDLREAICVKLKRDNNLDYKTSNIIVSTGAKHAIANVVLSLVNLGEEVLLPAPFWVTYKEMVKMAEGVPVVIETNVENNFKVSAAEIEAAITDKTKLIMFSTPCNPSGSVYGKNELETIARVVEKHPNIYIISDEIYELISFSGGHASIAQFDFIKDRVITVNGVSKGYAMTGWRIGYIAAPDWITQACIKLQGQFTSGASSIAQKAAKAAILADPSVTTHMKDAFLKRRDLVLQMLNDIEGMRCNIPEGAFYIFPDISYFFGKRYGAHNINNATDLSMYLLMAANVALVSGDAFGAPNCIRFSYAAAEDEITEACRRMKIALHNLS